MVGLMGWILGLRGAGWLPLGVVVMMTAMMLLRTPCCGVSQRVGGRVAVPHGSGMVVIIPGQGMRGGGGVDLLPSDLLVTRAAAPPTGCGCGAGPPVKGTACSSVYLWTSIGSSAIGHGICDMHVQ